MPSDAGVDNVITGGNVGTARLVAERRTALEPYWLFAVTPTAKYLVFSIEFVNWNVDPLTALLNV
jgi:hypothetical protein